MLARYYSPAGTFRFASVDPASESINPGNPQTWNRYTYVLNNPLVLIDPSGEDLVVSGSQSAQDKFKDTVDSGLFGKETKIDANGKVTLESNGVVGPPTPEQAALENTLNEAISNPGTTSITLSEGSGNTVVGEYKTGDIDMTDVKALGSGPGVTAAGALGHEIKEQFERQINGQPRGSETSGAHGAGIGAENSINGSVRGPQSQSLTGNKDGTVTGTITIPYTQGGKTTQSTLHVQSNNVVNVTRTKPK